MLKEIKSTLVWKATVSPLTNAFFQKKQQIAYFLGAGSAFKKPRGGLIPILNSSGGLLRELVENQFVELFDGMKILLVSEPSHAAQQLRDWLESEIKLIPGEVAVLEDLIGVNWDKEHHGYDLANLTDAQRSAVGSGWDLVVCQSLLEHVLDPVRVLDALVPMTSEDGIVSVQTVNLWMSYHAYPIDCLRFFPDFFLEYSSQRGIFAASWMTDASVFAMLTKTTRT